MEKPLALIGDYEMGGLREQVVEPPAKAPKTPSGQTLKRSGNAVRIHENKGEVHFHDDAAGKKCAVDVADFTVSWDKFIGAGIVEEGKQLRVPDKAGQTVAILTMIINDDASLDVDVAVEDIKYGPNLSKLRSFMQV